VCFLAAHLSHCPPHSMDLFESGWVRTVPPCPTPNADVTTPNEAHLIRGPPDAGVAVSPPF
jgi:hypothetical protein